MPAFYYQKLYTLEISTLGISSQDSNAMEELWRNCLPDHGNLCARQILMF